MSGNRGFSELQVDQQHRKADRRVSRLVSLPLLIIITVGLTNAHSETSLLSTSSKSEQSPNLAHNNSPLASKNEPSDLDQVKVVFERDTAEQQQQQQQQQQQHLASNFNNANNHVLLLGRSGYQQQQDSTKVYGLSNQFLQLNNDNPLSRDQTYQRMMANGDGEKVVANSGELDLGSSNQQLKKNVLPTEGELLLQQVDGGPYEVLENEHSKHNHAGQQQVMERRFGLFKKGQHQNNNLPFSNFGPVPYLYDCEQCLSQSGMASQSPAWMLEPQPMRQPMIYPLIYPTSHSSVHQFNPFKSKFSKLQLTKLMPESDSHYGASYQVNPRYRLPLTSRSPYQSNSHRFNCIQPPLLGNGLSGVGQSISSQGSLEDSKIPQQVSYSSPQY